MSSGKEDLKVQTFQLNSKNILYCFLITKHYWFECYPSVLPLEVLPLPYRNIKVY